MMVYWLVGLTLFNLYLLWKVKNHERSLLSIRKWGMEVDKSLLRFARSLTKQQVEVFTQTLCQKCEELLPENTARTHDGKLLCPKCKREYFQELERIIKEKDN